MWSFISQHSLFGIGDVFFHVVQCTLCDPLLKNEVLQLVTVTVILDTSGDFAKAVQEHFIICTVLLIIPRVT